MKQLFIILFSVLPLGIYAQTLPTDDADLAKTSKQLRRSIPMELGKIEGNMPQINILIKKGEKVQAKAMVEEALQKIANIEEDQQKLALLDENADEETLMIAEVQETKRYLIEKANKLRNAIGIYITCDAKLFNEEYPMFLKELQGELSQLGISFVDSVNQADWSISIKASTREYNKVELGGAANYFAYADATLTIDKLANGKRVYEDAISEKGGHTHNYDKAAREAYKYLAPRISAIIKEQIEK